MLIIALLTAAFILYLLYQGYTYSSQIKDVPYRILVNGIRGKSSVTRYIAAVYREAGITTYAKTTGTEARIIDKDGNDINIHRNGYPNVNEQIYITSNFIKNKAECIVSECMAVNPLYQEWLQNKIIISNISVITNVRTDHTDYMGETLESIANSLAATIPTNGILITSEKNPKLLNIFREKCKSKNTKLKMADIKSVSDEDLAKFDYYVHKENIAIALEFSKLLGLDNDKAITAMSMATPDPGTFKLTPISYKNINLVWANLFAINDKESFVQVAKDLYSKLKDYKKVVILNNRFDRPGRVKVFTDVITKQKLADLIVTFGDYEIEVNKYALANKYSADKIINLGNEFGKKSSSVEEIMDEILKFVPGKNILIVGAVNIHTEQADRFLEWLKHSEDAKLPVFTVNKSTITKINNNYNFRNLYAN